ncbi:hypothetical protein L915_07089, partial [Phytophthora nicotianae]
LFVMLAYRAIQERSIQGASTGSRSDYEKNGLL